MIRFYRDVLGFVPSKEGKAFLVSFVSLNYDRRDGMLLVPPKERLYFGAL